MPITYDASAALAHEVKVGDRLTYPTHQVTGIHPHQDGEIIFFVVTGGRYGAKVVSYGRDDEVRLFTVQP